MKIDALPFCNDPLGRYNADRAQGETRRRPLVQPAVRGSAGADGGYSPGYLADHWCSKGHAALPRGGAAHELQDGRVFTLTPGMSYQVADDAEPHRSTPNRAPASLSSTEPPFPLPLCFRILPMLELRPNCECCDRDLPADTAMAYICSFECTFCAECNDQYLHLTCPNCGGGELVRRPSVARRPSW